MLYIWKKKVFIFGKLTRYLNRMRKKQGGKIPKNQGQNVSLNNHFIHMEYSVVENNLYGYMLSI